MSKCFCHITDKNGNEYEVKDAFARQQLGEIEGRVDGKLAVFNENSAPVLERMEEVNRLTAEKAEEISEIAESAKEAIRGIVDTDLHNSIQTEVAAAKKEVNQTVNNAKSTIDNIVAQKEQSLDTKVQDSMQEIGSATEAVNAKVEAVNNTIDAFNLHYSNIGSSEFDVRNVAINSGTSYMPLYIDRNNEYLISVNAQKLTFLVKLLYKQQSDNTERVVRLSFDAYPAKKWNVSANPANTLIQTYEIKDTDYTIKIEIRESTYNASYHKIKVEGMFAPDASEFYPYKIEIDRVIIIEES